ARRSIRAVVTGTAAREETGGQRPRGEQHAGPPHAAGAPPPPGPAAPGQAMPPRCIRRPSAHAVSSRAAAVAAASSIPRRPRPRLADRAQTAVRPALFDGEGGADGREPTSRPRLSGRCSLPGELLDPVGRLDVDLLVAVH